jgi:hypothetical protein
MLEGFEWRGSVGHYSGDGGSGSGGGGFGKGRKADEIEKRLIGELKALEAVSSDCSIFRLLSPLPHGEQVEYGLTWSFDLGIYPRYHGVR